MSSIDTTFSGANVANAINFTNLPLLNNLYIFLGEASAPDSNSPTPATNVNYEKYTREGMFYLQQLAVADMCLVIPKIMWQSGTIYTQYSSSDPDLFSKNFYAIVNNNVYKCLSNNGGVPSTYAPVDTSVHTLILADGYEWKFMYNLNSELQSNFTIDNYFPCPINSQKTAQQIVVEVSAVEDTESPSGGHGYASYLELPANNVMISKGIPFVSISDTAVVAGQYGLILNPLFDSGVILTDMSYVIGSPTTINKSSGILMQTEQFDLITSTDEDNAIILQWVLGF